MIADPRKTTSIDGAFQQFDKQRGETAPDWLREARRGAFEQFSRLGFPSARDEEWRFTNIRPLISRQFHLARPTDLREFPADVDLLGDEHAFHRLVFANGHFVSHLSCVDGLPAGVVVSSLEKQWSASGSSELCELTRQTSFDNSPFRALNAAFVEDGAFVRVAPGVTVERPIELVFLATQDGAQTMSHPRNFLLLGRGSEATVIERYVGMDGEAYFNNVVTEATLEDDSKLDHYKLQEEGTTGYHIATLNVHQRDRSSFSSHYICRGAALARNEVNCRLDGEAIDCRLNGVYLGSGDQHLDSRTRIDHEKPNCHSKELYKGILDDRAHGVFNGKIYVHPAAQKTDAKQSNQVLLLSEDAVIDTKPQLEIYADDVKCTHGSTVGELDQRGLQYLRSRGIPADLARSMLIFAFANEAVRSAAVPEIQKYVESLLLAEQDLAAV